jgi:hypothetical protein
MQPEAGQPTTLEDEGQERADLLRLARPDLIVCFVLNGLLSIGWI